MKRIEQGVDRGVPRLVGGGVGELERSGHVAGGVDVGVEGLQVFVGLHRAGGRGGDAELLQSIALGIGHPADRDQHLIEGDAHVLAVMLGDQYLLAVLDFKLFGLVVDEDLDAFRLEAPRHQFRDFRISRIMMRGAISTWVTWAPRRAKVWVSSEPIGPPPSTTSRRGSARSSQTLSEVR